jgi:hypothetical protein
LFQFPDERVFAPAAANDQEFHSESSVTVSVAFMQFASQRLALP